MEENATVCDNCQTEVKAPKPAAPIEEPAFAPEPQPAAKKPFPVKPVLIGVAVLLVIILAFKLIGGGGSQSSPESTVKSYVNAIDDVDIDKLISLYAPDDRPKGDELKLAKKLMKQTLKAQDFSVSKCDIVKVKKKGKKAEVEYKIVTKYKGKKNTNQDTIDVIKVDGKWYIDQGLGL